MAADTKYRVLKHTGPFTKGEVVTAEQIAKVGGDVEDWKKIGSIVSADVKPPPAEAPRPAAPPAFK